MFGLAIHGGAGTLPRAESGGEKELRYRAGLAADGDLGLRARLGGVERLIVIEALEKVAGGGEQALAFFRERLDLGVAERRGAEDIHRHHRIHDGLVAGGGYCPSGSPDHQLGQQPVFSHPWRCHE